MYQRLPDVSPIFSAELQAIILVLPHLSTFPHSDYSKTLYHSSEHYLILKLENPLISKIYHSLQLKGKSLTFCCAPDYAGIVDNDIADRAAKLALMVPSPSRTFRIMILDPCFSVYSYFLTIKIEFTN